MASEVAERPTRVRYGVMILVTFVAILLYLDRYCLSTADRAMKIDLALSEEQMADVLGAFFLTYAVGQIPFGILSDRHGPRRTLACYMIVWSALTGFIGLARGYFSLVLFRFGCGLFEAGAYPACAGIIKRWIPYRSRGLASGIVSLGGRLGGTITPKLTAILMVALAGWHTASPSQQTCQAMSVQGLTTPTGLDDGIARAAVAAELATLDTATGWRSVMLLYGLYGVGLAVVFWLIFRDSPREHSACNSAEADLILSHDPNPSHQDQMVPLKALFLGVIKNASLWFCSLVQFGINFGWVFLITYLNRYLQEVHHVPIETRGTMNSLVIGLSLPALIVGGWLTDKMTRRLGQRWGRCLPLTLSRFVSAAAFLAVPFVDNPWIIVLLFGAVAFFSDLGLPALWAYNMDVGGRNVGFVLGWGNMWGNLGAALSPKVLNMVVQHFVHEGKSPKFAWDAVFLTCGLVFVVVGFASLWVDATKRVDVGEAAE